MDSCLSQGYLYVNECKKLEQNSKQVKSNCHPLHKPHIQVYSTRLSKNSEGCMLVTRLNVVHLQQQNVNWGFILVYPQDICSERNFSYRRNIVKYFILFPVLSVKYAEQNITQFLRWNSLQFLFFFFFVYLKCLLFPIPA